MSSQGVIIRRVMKKYLMHAIKLMLCRPAVEQLIKEISINKTLKSNKYFKKLDLLVFQQYINPAAPYSLPTTTNFTANSKVQRKISLRTKTRVTTTCALSLYSYISSEGSNYCEVCYQNRLVPQVLPFDINTHRHSMTHNCTVVLVLQGQLPSVSYVTKQIVNNLRPLFVRKEEGS